MTEVKRKSMGTRIALAGFVPYIIVVGLILLMFLSVPIPGDAIILLFGIGAIIHVVGLLVTIAEVILNHRSKWTWLVPFVLNIVPLTFDYWLWLMAH